MEREKLGNSSEAWCWAPEFPGLADGGGFPRDQLEWNLFCFFCSTNEMNLLFYYLFLETVEPCMNLLQESHQRAGKASGDGVAGHSGHLPAEIKRGKALGLTRDCYVTFLKRKALVHGA